jgi:hypothetical protein
LSHHKTDTSHIGNIKRKLRIGDKLSWRRVYCDSGY